MSLQSISQLQPHSEPGDRPDESTQYGAVCYRLNRGKAQVLLVTSRGTGRWIVPKGWPVRGETPAGSAMVEAYEEAGVEGFIHPNCLGLYSYTKERDGQSNLPCVVALYALRVKKLLDKFPENGQRKRKWYSFKRASTLVDEPELRAFLRNFDPRQLEN